VYNTYGAEQEDKADEYRFPMARAVRVVNGNPANIDKLVKDAYAIQIWRFWSF
jgi:hypothetical protein